MAIKEIYNSYDDALEGLNNNMSIMTDAENCIKNCIDSFGTLDI